MNTPITLRVDDELLARLDELAALTDRSRNWILRDAVIRYLDEEQQWIDRVKRGLEEADQGKLVPHDEVMAEMRALIKDRAEKG
ncbi:MAG: CopG family ribbon-helix-helix protein [Pseudomonadota bacterium]